MSGSSRHGSVRPPAAAGRRSAAGSRSGAAGQPGPGGGRGAGGQGGPDSRGSDTHRGGQAPAAVDADRVAALLAPVASGMDMDLEGVRITAVGRRRLLRIVLDADGGLSLDDIAQASRELSAVLDDSSVMGEHPYTLEVSSPGVDRPLTERRHWRRAIGRLVVVPLAAPADGPLPATVEGRITGASADGITIDVAGQSRTFGYGDLGPGKIKVEFAPIDAVAGDGIEGTGEDDLSDEDADDHGADEEGSGGY